MFYGTNIIYVCLYYLTTMAPAYLLFFIQLNSEFLQINDANTAKIILIMIVIFLTLGLLLKLVLRDAYIKGQGTPCSKDMFGYKNIDEINGNIVSFVLGNILPSIILIENSIFMTVMVFLIIQIIIFILVIKSSDFIPNVILLIMGVNHIKTKDGNCLLVIGSVNLSKPITAVYQIGNSNKSRVYITKYGV